MMGEQALAISPERQAMAQELWLQAKRHGYSAERFRLWVAAGLQLETYSRDDLLLADEQQFSLLFDRLAIEAEAPARQLPNANEQDFWHAANKELRVPRFKALEIKDAWTINDVVDWSGAFEELQRRFGRQNRGANANTNTNTR